MKQVLRTILLHTFPQAYSWLRELRWLIGGNDFERHYGKLGRVIAGLTGLRVTHGPFKGMKYVRCAVGGRYVLPRIIGSYEAELHETIEELVSAKYSVVINIGCAEGYYSVGLALRLLHARVYAFDVDVLSRQMCKRMARANGVEGRVIVQGECRLETLRNLPLKGAFILCDCEGCEFDLLNPELLPGLRHTDMLVELHDLKVFKPVTCSLYDRFSDSHGIYLIPNKERDPTEFAILDPLSLDDKLVCTDERRKVATPWMFMRAKNRRAFSELERSSVC